MSVNNTPNNTRDIINPSEVYGQLNVIQEWANTLIRHFPTAEMVEHGNNYLTIRIRYDDIFRHFYNDIKNQLNDAVVSLKECEYDKEYGICMAIKTSHIITNLKEIGFVNTNVVVGDGYMLYYVPFKDMLYVFDNMWKEANHNKPIRFEFKTRRITDKKQGKSIIYHYITIKFIQVKKL
jgi:hypothetical protein